jgi:hypothetical protein
MNQKYLIPKREKYIFSGVCLLLLIIHMIFPQAISWISIALLGLALAPWIIHIIKGVELPGGAKFEFGYLEQTTGEIPPSPSKSPQSPQRDDDLLLDQNVIKTLKTLMKSEKAES